MNLKLTPKAQKILYGLGNSAIVRLDKQICYS